MLRQLRKCGLALLLSAIVLLTTVIVQGLTFFRGPLVRLATPQATYVRCFSTIDDDQSAFVLVRRKFVLEREQIKYAVCKVSTTGFPQQLPLPLSGLSPWRATGAARAQVGFMSTPLGDLYSFDLSNTRAPPIHLGCHQEITPALMECDDEGAILVVANEGTMSCWDRASARCLWRRSDIGLIDGKFLANTQRFLAALSNGAMVELNLHSGAVQRELPNRCGLARYLDISNDGRFLSAIDHGRVCVISDLESGETLWSKQYPVASALPRFSPDGSLVVSPDENRLSRLALRSRANGELLGELTGAKAEITGIAVTRQGRVFAWDQSGALTAWDLATRSLVFQLYPGQSM